jgi:hypothetical protein
MQNSLQGSNPSNFGDLNPELLDFFGGEPHVVLPWPTHEEIERDLLDFFGGEQQQAEQAGSGITKTGRPTQN